MGKKYIYNQRQAQFYIKHDIKVIDTGVHYTTKKPFWVFVFDETKEVYLQWLKSCEQYKKNKAVWK